MLALASVLVVGEACSDAISFRAGTIDCLDSFGAGCVERLSCGFGGRTLGLAGSVDWLDPLMRGMLVAEGRRMVELL
jgi:hypothetical protein